MKKPANKKSAVISSSVVFFGITASYIGMYERITCKPTQAGFWYILIMGFSLGTSIILFAFRLDEKKKIKKEAKN